MSQVIKLFNTLMSIRIPPQLTIVNGVQELVDNMTFNDIFEFVKVKHYHCEGGRTCPHSESLYEHLCNVAEFSYIRSKKLNYSEHECIKAWITGLLHDIGKPGTLCVNKKYTSFKGHGIVGSAMLINFWSNEIFEKLEMTKEDWGDICACTCVHMCGYFSQQTTHDHIFNMKILPINVKRILVPLRYGDQMGLVKWTDKPEYDDLYENSFKNETALIDDEADFIKNIDIDNSISITDINEYLKTTNKDKGVLIQVIGTSSSGKSSFVNKLVNILGKDKTVHISRDFHMINAINKENGFKLLENYDEITPVIYQKSYKIYIDTGKALAQKINNNMMNECTNGLLIGKIVIIDSMITMFQSANSVIPDIAINSYKINFWMNRNKMITSEESETRLGMSYQSQITTHGDCNVYNPYRQEIIWRNMVSLTENHIIEKNKTKAHLSISVGWNDCMDHIIHHLSEKILIIYNYNNTITRLPLLEDTMDMTLIELITELKKIDGIEEFFKAHNYIVNKTYRDVVGIKYIDGLNKIWKPKWAREARGRFYYIGDKTIELKSGLQRGIEVLTKKHIDAGITETQDINFKPTKNSNGTPSHLNPSGSLTGKDLKWDILNLYRFNRNINEFDKVQEQVLELFSGENTVDCVISAKVDGSLLIMNVYPAESEQNKIMYDIIDKYADGFSKELANYCRDNNMPLITIATQGTLLISEHMQDYFLTALQCLIEIPQFESLILSWKAVIPEFVNLVIEYYKCLYNQFKNKDYITMFFEAYCKDRTTIIGNNLHTELAVAYDHNGLNLLGVTNRNIYIPHFNLPQLIFKQPFFLKITNTKQVFERMELLDNIIIGKANNEDLKCVHPEGFVLLTKINNIYDYAKIKTKLYYDCHKVKKDNIKNLLSLDKNCEKYYPIIPRLRSFFENLRPSLLMTITETMIIFKKEINTESQFYTGISSKGKKHIDEVIKDGDNSKISIVYKIFLHTRETNAYLISILKPLILNIFSVRCGSNEDFISFIKNLIMKIQPWENDWINRLDKLILDQDEIINQLYGLIIGYKNT